LKLLPGFRLHCVLLDDGVAFIDRVRVRSARGGPDPVAPCTLTRLTMRVSQVSIRCMQTSQSIAVRAIRQSVVRSPTILCRRRATLDLVQYVGLGGELLQYQNVMEPLQRSVLPHAISRPESGENMMGRRTCSAGLWSLQGSDSFLPRFAATRGSQRLQVFEDRAGRVGQDRVELVALVALAVHVRVVEWPLLHPDRASGTSHRAVAPSPGR
jgi:hypothetical protein